MFTRLGTGIKMTWLAAYLLMLMLMLVIVMVLLLEILGHEKGSRRSLL